jgi:hypothetical protein
MIRELHHIPLADLKPSKLNVRCHGPKEIDSLAASIAGLGLIHPLLVRARDEGLRPRPRDPCRTGWLERDDTAHLRPVTR